MGVPGLPVPIGPKPANIPGCQIPIRAPDGSSSSAWMPRSATGEGSNRVVAPRATAAASVPAASAEVRKTPHTSARSMPGCTGMQPATGMPPTVNMK